MAAFGRMIFSSGSSGWQRIFTPSVTTTDGTPAPLLQTQVAIPDNRAYILKASVIVRNADFSQVSAFYNTEAVVARSGGVARLINSDAPKSVGEISPANSIGLGWVINVATSQLSLMATGKAGATLTWIANIEFFRTA